MGKKRWAVRELLLIFLLSFLLQYGLEDQTSGEGTVNKDLAAERNCISVAVSPRL